MPVRYELVGAVPPNGGPRRRWAFGHADCPLRLAKTPTGLGGAKFAHARQSNARQAGGTWRGRVDDVNVIDLDVHIGPVQPGLEAVNLWSTWRGSLGYGDSLAEFHAHSPGGGDRWQYVRLETPSSNPGLDGLVDGGYMREQVALGSDVSWWESRPIERTYTLATPAPATIQNRGTVDAWPYWEITGPCTPTLGVNGEAVTLPAIPAGVTWQIETDPEGPFIRRKSDGADMGETVGVKAWFKPVPAGRTVQLTAVTGGATSSTAVFQRLPQLWTEAVA